MSSTLVRKRSPAGFHYDIEDSIVYDIRSFKYSRRSGLMHPAVPVCY